MQKELVKVYLETAIGSAFKWETQVIIANNLGYINQQTFEYLENKIKRYKT